MRSFTPKFIREWVIIIKQEGFKSFTQKKGWKVVAGFILFYLIRDLILYLLIPYLVINNIIKCQ